MKYWTLAEIRAKIEAECDLEDETFIRKDELTSYINEAIDEAEAEIHSLYEDYFLKKVTTPVSVGSELFSIPTLMPDIYGDKIRRIIFTRSDNITSYTVSRMKDWRKFEEKAIFDSYPTTDLYRYFLINETPGNPQIILVPKAREAGTLTIWYIRNANRLSADTDVCDIPEFINFIFSHVKMKVYGKEGHPDYSSVLERLETERQRMLGVLSARTPDAENEIEPDMSFYSDMS